MSATSSFMGKDNVAVPPHCPSRPRSWDRASRWKLRHYIKSVPTTSITTGEPVLDFQGRALCSCDKQLDLLPADYWRCGC